VSEPSVPIGRLAPSPTGRLHLGHARTFALAWAHARSRGGRVLLRMEDLDASRCRPEWASGILADLEWLGLDWDGAVVYQSQRIEALRAAGRELERSGAAYACVCTRSDLKSAASAPQRGVEEQRYPGTCRGRFASREAARAATGRAPALRFRVPDGPLGFVDAIAGAQSFDVAATVGDFVICNRADVPAYQLAVVVDDAEQKVNEVFRGDDLLSSTPRQIALHRALGSSEPVWYHVPLVLDAAGRRLAKRADDLSLATLRELGTDPRAIVSWVAASAGFSLPERCSARELAGAFELSRLRRDPVLCSEAVIDALKRARQGMDLRG
jgi:glutamyl-tRNA synthetase